MGTLLLVALAGFMASFVDGALGMGFGPTSSSILLATGLTPAAVSTTVNLAKVVTGTAGGAAHWRFGNVDRRLVLQLAGPGVVGAVVGVTVLANVDGDAIRPYLSGLLLVVGLRILVRFLRQVPAKSSNGRRGRDRGRRTGTRRGLMAAGFTGGITNGLIGAWGPVVTPVLLSRDDVEPRVAIGSVNTAEVAVACAASGSLIASVGAGGLDVGVVIAMLVGGTLAAPVAAWAVRHIAPAMLGVGAGGLLVLTSVRDLSGAAGLGVGRWPIYIVVVAGSSYAAVRAYRRHRAAKAQVQEAERIAAPLHGPPVPAPAA
jgi:uncharacterized membrane protein YfcA